MIAKPDTCKGCPLYEKPHGKPMGFSYPTGSGKNGVMIIAEALGKDEELTGMGLVGKSGYALFQQLKRVDVDRDDFTIFNTIACRPPDNKLVGMPYMQSAISHCKPNLEAAIKRAKAVAHENSKTFVIITLGVTPFKAILGLDSKKDAKLLKKDYWGYPHWSAEYQAWVLACPHPAYLIRGNTHLWPIVQWVFQRALEIASNGMLLETPTYELDPPPTVFDEWVKGYERSLLLDPDNPLSYDIETPYKKKTDSEDELGKEEDADHTILRISFAYATPDGATHVVSVKWSAEFMAGIERLFDTANYVLGWNSDKYDSPRVRHHVPIRGIGLDGMIAWHILNSALPKALGFVTPYYWQNTAMWKHTDDVDPAYYNAKDADAALRCWIGIKRDLIQHRLWAVYERHWIELQKALRYMTGVGVLRDEVMRSKAEEVLAGQLDTTETRMEEVTPVETRAIKVYKKAPKVITDGMYETTKEYPIIYCGVCGLQGPKRWKKHATLCGGEPTSINEPRTIWAKPLPFKISKNRMTSYQQYMRHQAILDRKEHKITFNADAITLLTKKYPGDRLYPLILEHRKAQKLLSTYVGATDGNRVVGGMAIGRDGRIHTQYGRDASTLRFTSEEPNLQNLPRPNPTDPSDPTNFIRNIIVGGSGNVLYARDYSGIEAVLTGYFALDPRYIRLAKHDVHTYYTVYALYELEGGSRIKAADLPELDWPDDRLFPYLEQLKKEFKRERNSLYKHLVHAANFMQGAKGARDKIFSETGIEYPVTTVQRVMDVYYALFPKIKQWHRNVLDEAEKDGYLRNPFDYVCRYSRVYDYKKEYGEWVRRPGTDANKVIAFKPQSTAVGIITEALLRLYFERFEDAGQYMRLQVHDELLFEIPRARWESVNLVVKAEMEKSVPQLKVPASWGMGDQLGILTEAKVDLNDPSRWGSMRGFGD